VQGGLFEILTLSRGGQDEAEEEDADFALHMARVIIAPMRAEAEWP
jgi:hypothetical protein